MATSSAELQPHEFPASKTEALMHSVRSSATDKIDLVLQRVARHGTPISGGESTYYLRFWRYAHGQVCLQEVPLQGDELLDLSVYVLDRMKKALAADDEALADEDKKYTFKHGAGSWSKVENKDGKDTEPTDKALIRVVADSDGGYTAFGFYKGISYTSGSSPSIAEALRGVADDIESNLDNAKQVAEEKDEPHEDPVVEAVVAAQAEGDLVESRE